ncbi:MAG: hypothetical protein UZ17_ACD001001924 [Acidobacteria bacterium OLB17]|nr:MAG: hypothetical protein UZ17_ACD001001924 [Acidobacteria bacterium OLB17]MCZ2390194.1 hypothetical protein [Acidobacteriota bacterium]
MDTPRRYWFRAKRYGWGWGLPATWEGWLTFAIFIALFVLLLKFFPPPEHTFTFVLGTLALIIALIAVCFAKGEPPKWHWGRKG